MSNKFSPASVMAWDRCRDLAHEKGLTVQEVMALILQSWDKNNPAIERVYLDGAMACIREGRGSSEKVVRIVCSNAVSAVNRKS